MHSDKFSVSMRVGFESKIIFKLANYKNGLENNKKG